MSRIVAFSKYLAYAMGGAEKSTLALLDIEQAQGNQIALSSLEDAHFLGKRVKPTLLDESWQVHWVKDYLSLRRFAFFEYVLNKRRLRDFVTKLDADTLWTYGMWAPTTTQFNGQIICFIRSETDLGIQTNAQVGFRLIAQRIYRLIEAPAKWCFIRDLKRLLKRSSVVANSEYMANLIWTQFKVRSSVITPAVDVEGIRAKLGLERQQPKYVVFVGDNAGKGIGIVKQVASRLPQVQFRIVTRFIDTVQQESNIEWMPWQAESWRLYRDSALVICPSQWAEAYGRVAREAYLLGIPVLASDLGGLPEAVDHCATCLVKDYTSPDAWLLAIEQKLGARIAGTNDLKTVGRT
jgi:glycosyltransferase involved in cell wall biosynthesis